MAAFAKRIDELIASGQTESALRLICEIALGVANSAHLLRQVWSSPVLDGYCVQIGAGTWPWSATGGDPVARRRVYVVTELHSLGGHARLLSDFVRLQPGPSHHVLATNLFDRDAALVVPDFIGAAVQDVRVAPGPGLLAKLHWLQKQLAELKPAEIFLLHHWHDAVAVAGVQPAAGNCAFIHHSDYTFTLGLHVPHFAHVDLHALGFERCRRAQIAACTFWPIVIDDLGARDASTICRGDGIATTCSSGTLNKFEGPYPFSYFDLVPSILERTGGRHVHLGPLDELSAETLKKGLMDRGIGIERLVHVPSVKSLWTAMAEYEVDAYISSFPVYGGRAALEVIGSGTPILSHESLLGPALSDFHLLHPDALRWTRPDDLLALLGSLTAAELRSQAAKGREWYVLHNRPNCLIPLLSAPVGTGVASPGPGLQPTNPAPGVDPPDPHFRGSRHGIVVAAQIADRAAEREQFVATVDALSHAVDERDQRIVQLAGELSDKAEKLVAGEQRIAAIYASRSWRLLAPLRFLRSLFGRTD